MNNFQNNTLLKVLFSIDAMYSSINHSTIYYPLNGYQYINTPWIVDESISDITKPKDKKNFYVNKKALVASGEQSFLQLIIDSKIEPGKYCTVTPCFRDEEREDETHKQYFMKTELIYWEKLVHSTVAQYKYSMEQSNRMSDIKNKMVNLCIKFFEHYLGVKQLFALSDGSVDIISEIGEYELGSYGVRTHGDIIWVYGTGCAEPRLSYVISKYIKPGYHCELIPKTKDLSSVEKIIEEYNEFLDALKQKNKIMALVELSDMYGAINHYLKSNYNMTMDDLKVMSEVTERAFLNGRR